MNGIRQPAGQPSGGQFATQDRPGSGIALVDVDAFAHTRSRLVEATDWESDYGLDRERFDALLDNVPPAARDDAWTWVEYLSKQEAAAHEEDDIPTDQDLVSATAADSATEATSLISDEFDRDQEFTATYFNMLATDYSMTRDDVIETVAGWQHGQHGRGPARVSKNLPDLAVHAEAVEPGTNQAA